MVSPCVVDVDWNYAYGDGRLGASLPPWGPAARDAPRFRLRSRILVEASRAASERCGRFVMLCDVPIFYSSPSL